MNPRILVLMVVFAAIFAAAGWFAITSLGTARQSITLTGVNGRERPVSLVVERGSELVACRAVRPNMARCMLFDSNRATQLESAYERQLIGQGWARVQSTQGAVGLLFRRTAATEACPPVVMIIPGAEERFATRPTPAGKEFRVIGYSFDLFCRARAALAETIVLTGMDGRHGPMQLTLNNGATLGSCGERENRVTRCILVDVGREADVMADFVAQLTNSGWVSREPGPGAAPGLRVFARAGDRERCPHLVLIIPRSAPRGAAPAPDGQVYFTIGYAPDARCLLGLGN